ncbi:MAG: hypothetical protein O7C67_06200 [Gammaproteobacteria bacterium]|nr:hypothetical protein [Gammaproteobacteria bacterium]
MNTEIHVLEHAEHVALQGNVNLLDLHLLLARRTANEAVVTRDIVLDLGAANVGASVREISTFIVFLANDLLARLGTRRFTVVTGSEQIDFNWDTIGLAAIHELAASHERFDVVDDIARVKVDGSQNVAESAPPRLADRRWRQTLSFEIPTMDVTFVPA